MDQQPRRWCSVYPVSRDSMEFLIGRTLIHNIIILGVELFRS
jgi:hypothetical protein